MANIKKAGSSTGKKSTKTRTLASEKGKVEKPSKAARTKSENASGLKTLADILSLLQEDVRRYNEALVSNGQDTGAQVNFNNSAFGVVILHAPIDHSLGYRDGHILLDDKPVTGWGE